MVNPIRPLLFLGEALAEVMRPGVDEPLDRPGSFVGPFPSGAPAIAADAAARMGAPVSFIGTVGEDAFGRLFKTRMERDGIETSRIATVKGESTGVAFVSYRGDGSRAFVFHLGAAGHFEPWQCQPEDLDGVHTVHLSGSTPAFNATWQAACLNVARWARERGAILSFDPNIRPELAGGDWTAIRKLTEWCDILLPSAGEAAALTGLADDDAACRHFAARGKLVALKRGPLGCRAYPPGREPLDVGTTPVTERDPTGAGDAFAGGLLAALYRGEPLERALRRANACGASCAAAKGPMEGLPRWEETQGF